MTCLKEFRGIFHATAFSLFSGNVGAEERNRKCNFIEISFYGRIISVLVVGLTRSLIPVHKSRLYTRKLARVTHDRRVVNIRWPGNKEEQLVVSWKPYARASPTSWPVISAQKRTSNQ